MLINFANDLSLSYAPEAIEDLIKGKKTIVCATHDLEWLATAELTIPVSSYSEYEGCVVNCDGILQKFSKAVTKNNELPTICQIAAEFGSPLTTPSEIFAELQQTVGALKQYQPTTIPAEGLNLNDSEVANVTA